MPITLSLFYEQSWAFVHFLYSGENGKYRDDLIRFLNMILMDKVSYYDKGKTFRSIFKMKSKRDFEKLDAAFQAFVTKHLMRMDVERFAYEPPPLGRSK